MLSRRHIFHAILSGIILFLPWYEQFSGLLLFVALVPLLLVEESMVNQNRKSGKPMFLYASISFLLWNIGATWWIVNATFAGFCAAVLVNTILLSSVFCLYHITNKIAGRFLGKVALIAYWVAFEYFYLNAEISWPWLNLGNGFGHNTELIQWYEYTGTLGGTVWVLTINLLIFEVVRLITKGEKILKMASSLVLCLVVVLLPILFSHYLYSNYKEKGETCKVVVVQPNADPYNNSVSVSRQCSNLLNLADSLGNKSINFFVAPEVSIEDNVWENALTNNYSVPTIQSLIQKYPDAAVIYGSYTYKRYGVNEVKSPTAQYTKAGGYFYDSYNSAIQLDSSLKPQLYHKSKLVVGVEKMPYPKTLGFLRKTVEILGGSFSSHGTQDFRGVFSSANEKYKVAPVICYESVYGEYVTDYVKNGANLIFVITNDGWWGNTPGHRQHLGYSRLRALETRRSIARSANTGISAFIDQRGNVINSLGWGRRGAIEASINTNEDQTFYVKHGDYLGRVSYFISAFIVSIIIIKLLSKRFFQ